MVHIDDEKTQKLNIRFIEEAMRMPMLKKEEEKKLLTAWVKERSKTALNKIITAHLKLAVSVALKFRNYNLPIADLIQEACIGLMIAAKKFDLKKKVRFSTYAGWWIRSSIQDYVLKNWSVVRTGTTAKQKKLYFSLKSAKAKLSKYLRSDGLLSQKGQVEVAKKLKVNPKDIAFMDGRLSHYDHSLNTPLTDDAGNMEIWQNMITDDKNTPNTIIRNKHDRKLLHDWIQQGLNKLDPRSRIVIMKRWLSTKKTTLKDLAAELHVSKERVRQIERKAFLKLKQNILLHIKDVSDVV
jgi:RNA polymerase sigma-32 factor